MDYNNYNRGYIEDSMTSADYMTRTYGWMAAGLLVTFAAAFVTAATPLTYLKGDDIAATFQTLTETYSVGDMFLGKCGGSLGEVSALCLLLGLVWLLYRKVISWHIPVSYIATVAVLTRIFPRGGADGSGKRRVSGGQKPFCSSRARSSSSCSAHWAARS